ncbi:phage tail tube protein [Agromyces cerinus]|uniref:Uncharacterized protein n=1 Tax=Agromyces cerinus subsp. cerinus TaxID=232089 RepID=A0A1N6DQ52_9MICO|nr:hypothetical protein [Agromyces cerinus]SIN72847.1 hypothetical protein SAMN05443544_0579 [Agromyces cerinus subsp. cerinus]
MALETTPTSSQSDGKWRIWSVPIGSNALSVAILNGATAKSLTYGLTADGFDHQTTQATVEDKRLTLVQDLSAPGRVTETVNLKVVSSTTSDSADQVLSALAVSGALIQLTVRRAVDNATIATVAQVVDVLTGRVGVRRADAPVENGVDTAQYQFFPSSPTQRQAVLVA